MNLRVHKCPNCGANLSASEHARFIDCTFCGGRVRLDPAAVERQKFKDALAWWDNPASHGFDRPVTLAGGHWAVGPRVGRGEISDVHLAIRARFPSETVAMRILRDPAEAPRMARAASVLSALQAAPDQALAARVPQLVAYEGRHLLTRWPYHHTRTLAQVGRIPARPAAWVWRRILEALAFVHRAGFVHGAIIPPHVLIEAGEHGARLVGFGNAGRHGDPLDGRAAAWAAIYPSTTLSIRDDLRMSARTVLAVTPESTGSFGDLLRRVADDGADDAWALRQAVGAAADSTFGKPAFCPILPRIS